MRLSSWLICLLALAAMLSGAGCEQDYVVEFRTLQASRVSGQEDPPAHEFWSGITFCERVSKKSGKRIRQGHSFVMGENSYVHGLVDLQNLPPGRTHSIHLVWLKPDTHELYRRYAEVRTESTPGGYRSSIVWLDAEDFGYRREEIQENGKPIVTLGSRLNTSLKRDRMPGHYTLRVYLNREFLVEEGFELAGG